MFICLQRKQIKGELEYHYKDLASESVPLTQYLFGDNLRKELKEVEFSSKIMSKNFRGVH